MKEMNKKKGPSNNQTRRSIKSDRRENTLQEKNVGKAQKAKESSVKVLSTKIDSGVLVSDSNTESEVSENMDIHYIDDEAFQESQLPKVVEQAGKTEVDNHSSDIEMENELEEGMKEESYPDITNDSLSSQGGEGQETDDVKIETSAAVPASPVKNFVSRENSHTPRVKSDRRTNNLQIKSPKTTPKQTRKTDSGPLKEATKRSNGNAKSMKVHPRPSSESSEGFEEVREADNVDVASNGTLSVKTDDEVVDKEKNVENESQTTLNQKIEEMEIRIGKLEEELREVAALEIALYSVEPEHGSSAHKVYTPARRLLRHYLNACKDWSQYKRATVARNTVSGLVFVGKSCGNDVPRLTFWLSNIVVLREILSQASGSCPRSSSVNKILKSKEAATISELKSSSLTLKTNAGGNLGSKQELMQFFDDWQEPRNFTTALEKIESWLFSRIVESIWWQTLTPNMQSPSDDSSTNKTLGRLLGPALGDQQQGSFSIDLWKNAFRDASRRLCPVRAAERACSCLPVLARKVMERCVERLDVAMFNAILRESAHEIPTDPVSDPIVDSKVLPIPAGNLSFGSGAQLKNSIGNWSRCLDDLFGVEPDDSVEGQNRYEDNNNNHHGDELQRFHLLSELSDLLMIPKDMVVDQTIRMEVCPSIRLPLVKRILCNFSPDEFCPDPVPGVVLEALNAECLERRLSGDSASNSFPYIAVPITYTPLSSINMAEKVADADGDRELARNASAILKKGYTSDEELGDLDSPLTSIVEKLPSSLAVSTNASHEGKDKARSSCAGANARYELLREVWH